MPQEGILLSVQSTSHLHNLQHTLMLQACFHLMWGEERREELYYCQQYAELDCERICWYMWLLWDYAKLAKSNSTCLHYLGPSRTLQKKKHYRKHTGSTSCQCLWSAFNPYLEKHYSLWKLCTRNITFRIALIIRSEWPSNRGFITCKCNRCSVLKKAQTSAGSTCLY